MYLTSQLPLLSKNINSPLIVTFYLNELKYYYFKGLKNSSWIFIMDKQIKSVLFIKNRRKHYVTSHLLFRSFYKGVNTLVLQEYILCLEYQQFR